MNPEIQILINLLRNQRLRQAQFRSISNKIAKILADATKSHISHANLITLIPILRSGLALLPAFLKTFPNANVGFVGLKRDEQTAKPTLYYKNIPPIKSDGLVIILDPMLATGGSAAAILKIITEMGIAQEQIIFVGLVSAPEGVAKLSQEFPQVKLVIGVQDQGLTKDKFITPGLGDFGDRFFGTE